VYKTSRKFDMARTGMARRLATIADMGKTVLTILLALLLLAAGAAGVGRYGAMRWNDETDALRARLAAGRTAAGPRTVDFRQLERLPAPVQRYFKTVLTDGQPMVAAASIGHRGTFNMGEADDAWKPFESDQRVVTRRPGFDWNGRVAMMPGVSAYVHDAYVGEEGILHASVLGLITVADMRGTKDMAHGELMRFLAEAAWYPTALLPGQGVQWTAVDARSAHATLADGDSQVTMLFTFDQLGLIATVGAAARGRTVGGGMVPTPWRGRFWNYQRRGGMLVPLAGEVAWLLPAGPKPYWRGTIEEIDYDFAN
jgi:hypothetical protein